MTAWLAKGALWANSADGKLMIFTQKIGFDISCKLGDNLGYNLHEMSRWQFVWNVILFSEKNKNHI